jgi:sugar O-acyltransferase (sialic acid O-acetyltransferase NeuD family)
MQSVAIIGAGGFAREVLDVFDAINRESPQYDVLGYIVDPQYGSAGTILNGLPILGGYDWLSGRVHDVFVICGVGLSQYRLRLSRRAEALGCHFVSIIHPTAVLTRWVELGQGVVITAGCILTNRIKIGNHVHVNLGCTIGHDAILEDFVTLAPGVHVSGNVTLKNGTYVGTGASIVERLSLGPWSTVGAGGVVIRDVSPNTTVVGVPARVIKVHEQGWHLL